MSKMNKKDDSEVLESMRSREIVAEVLDFGVSQYQIKKIIKLLSLELENIQLVKKISKLIDDDLEENCEQQSKIEI